jgi:hypothetical protein
VNFRNAIFYAPRVLLISYGTAISLASVCLAVGMAAMYNNGFAYTNNFSTILRITRDGAFDKLIEDDEDRAGADPLPIHIANATTGFVSGQDQHLGPNLVRLVLSSFVKFDKFILYKISCAIAMASVSYGGHW